MVTRDSADTLPLALTVSDCSVPGFPLVYVNRKFTEVTGYDKKDCEGRNCRFLQGPGTNPEHGQHLLDTLREGQDSQTMLLNYRKSGEPFENLLTMAYVPDSLGRRRFCIARTCMTSARERKSRRDMHVHVHAQLYIR